MISMPMDEFQSIMANCFNSCLKYHKPDAAPEEDEFVDIKGGQLITRSSESTFRRNARNREFASYKNGGKLLFLKSELVAWVKSGRRKTVGEIDQEIADSDKKLKRGGVK